ncbi:IQ motif [Macleaya cordata]|uniref:IQ motif n=1 Tax=Macleaya cordata TaxID=56857 RepID=A0A200R432_MACCD|nr:IQ motif [Macleaya cordata]
MALCVVHRTEAKGRNNAEPIAPLSCSSTSSPIFNTAQNQGSASAVSESYGAYQYQSPFEVSSDLFNMNDGMNFLDGLDIFNSSSDAEATQALQRIEEQLSLVDSNMGSVSPQCKLNEKSVDPEVLHCERTSDQDELVALQHGSEYRENGQHSCEILGEFTVERKELLDHSPISTLISSQEIFFNTLDGSEKLQTSSERGKNSADLNKHHEECTSQWLDRSGNITDDRNNCPPIFENNPIFHLSAAGQFLSDSDNPVASLTATSLLHPVKNSINFPYSCGTSTLEANPDYYRMLFDQETQLGTPVGVDSRLTVSQQQKFSIQEISPEWGYAAEQSKVIVTGYFQCNPSECAWACMFGDIEVPVEIIQEGVLRCQAPLHIPGKVTLCITTGNREACSEVREFEYRMTPNSSVRNSLPQTDGTKSTEELQLLIRFVQMLLCDTLVCKDDSVKSGTNALEKSNTDRYSWEHMEEGLLVGSESESGVMDWLLQELLKEKLPHWLFSKCKEGETPGCTLLKKEQEIIHMVAGLGFEWALNPILNSGIGINFRDSNGWTALHHAAHFGREKMVIALLAAGASAVAVTDPTSQDSAGKTPGSIAASRGHKGLAGYLSEFALTSHLSSLTLEESEISKGNCAVEAENTVESISRGILGCTEDNLSVRRSLDAVRNAALAAARIQAAFRQLSFKRRKEREALVRVCDEYGITAADIPALSASSKLTFHSLRDHVLGKAAVVIQKKYRGWKGQKEFLALRQKIVLIQAHVRGHQVRKKYKVILWAVGVLDKVMLRWRRKRVGLRGYRPESQLADASDDEDILKVFRKKKVDAAIEQAVSWVIAMAHSPGARRQYRRLLESYRQAKAELCVETTSVSQDGGEGMEINDDNNDFSQFL